MTVDADNEELEYLSKKCFEGFTDQWLMLYGQMDNKANSWDELPEDAKTIYRVASKSVIQGLFFLGYPMNKTTKSTKKL